MSISRFFFRVWNANEERYIEQDEDVSIHADGSIMGHHHETKYRFRIGCNGYIIEQCTGLIDKHGQLIYEGDIIRFDGWPGTPSHIVAWNPRTCRWVLRLPKDINLENTASLCLGDAADNEYIIVGNIHTSKSCMTDPLAKPPSDQSVPSVKSVKSQEPLP
ncbi:MAG: hypothetical protein J5858_05080 [Lentisphaeria bacterium]|nr:hypothetical protein [Lentisphaeria bacterium]